MDVRGRRAHVDRKVVVADDVELNEQYTSNCE